MQHLYLKGMDIPSYQLKIRFSYFGKKSLNYFAFSPFNFTRIYTEPIHQSLDVKNT